MIELKNSRTTYLGRASGRDRYSLDAFIGAVQMKEPGGEWQDIKPQLVRDTNGWHVRGAPYFAEIKDDGTRLFCPDKNEQSKYLRLPTPALFSGLTKQVISSPTKLDRLLLPNQITMPADWGEFRIIFSNTGMHFEVLFTKAPPAGVFGKDSPRILLDAETAGFDIGQLLNTASGIGIPKPRLIVSKPEITADEPQGRWLDWSYKNGQMELGFDFGDLPFPILLKNTTIDEQVGASGDDGYCYPGTFRTNGTYEVLGDAYGSNRAQFYRWTGITISGTVDVAYISVYAHQTSAGTPQIKVSFVDEDSPAAPTSEAEFNADPLTTEKVDWDGAISAGSWYNTSSLVNPIQELVDSYTIDNDAIMAQLHDDGGGFNNYHTLRMYDYSGNTYGAKLHIEYTAGGATEKTSAETGSGAEVSTMMAARVTEESGGGVDSKLSFLAGLAETDSGVGSEQGLLSLLISSADAGAGVEAAALLLAGILKGDSGSGAENILDRDLNLPDSGSGADALNTLVAAILASEAGGGIDQSTLMSIVAKLSADAGSGIDTAELIAGLVSSETGLGVDAGMIVGLKQLFSGDAGTSGDVLRALINISGSGSDMKLPGRQGRVGMPSRGVSL